MFSWITSFQPRGWRQTSRKVERSPALVNSFTVPGCNNSKYTSLWLLLYVPFFFCFLKLLNSILSSHTTGKKKKKKAVRIARGALPVQILPWIFIHGRICSAFAFLWTFLWINSYSSRSLWISKKPSKSMDFICKNVCESSLYFTPLAFNFASWPNILKERNKYAFSPLAHTRISNWLRMGQARVKKSWTAAGIICY